MLALLFLFLSLLISPLKPASRLEAENAALRQQLVVLKRKLRGRIEFTNGDRLFFILLYRLFLSVLKVVRIVRPDTIVCWHRAGFRRYWRQKSRVRGGRPPIGADLPVLIRDGPIRQAVQAISAITSRPVLGGLHHQYCRV